MPDFYVQFTRSTTVTQLGYVLVPDAPDADMALDAAKQLTDAEVRKFIVDVETVFNGDDSDWEASHVSE